MSDRIDNAKLREAVERSGLSAAEICRRAGHTYVSPDTSRLRRSLGLVTWNSGDGRATVTKTIDYDLAVKIAEAIHVAPVDVDL